MHYYVSIPALDHKVFKYAGYQSNDIESYDWHAIHGVTGSENEIADGPYLVRAYVEYLGDRINEDGEPYGKSPDFVPKQFVITRRVKDEVICEVWVKHSHPNDFHLQSPTWCGRYMLHVFQLDEENACSKAIAQHIEIELAKGKIDET